MLNVRSERCLAKILRSSLPSFHSRLGKLDKCYKEYHLVDPEKPEKRREILSIKGYWKVYLDRLYEQLLLPRLVRSEYSHGGVRGRSIVTNASAHRKSTYIYTADISDFFPSIHHTRIYELFVGRFGCSPNVARICTRLCTHDYHLAAGLQTSPILADQLLGRVDRRIGEACKTSGLVYTRFIDDITISGQFNLDDSGMIGLIEKIIKQDGFQLCPDKRKSGKLRGKREREISITGIRIKQNNLDVRSLYLNKVLQQIADAKLLAQGSVDYSGNYYTPDQILGRVRFICSVNPGRTKTLLQLYRQVPWRRVVEEAERRGLIAQKKLLEPKP